MTRNGLRLRCNAGGIVAFLWIALGPVAAVAQPLQDWDCDGIYDVDDNCSAYYNPGAFQCDTDLDGYGNVCDGDFDQDYMVFPSDKTNHLDPDMAGVDTGTGTNMDCSPLDALGNNVNANDYDPPGGGPPGWLHWFTSTGVPGPSGLACAGVSGCTGAGLPTVPPCF
jgi:hypothetical protein